METLQGRLRVLNSQVDLATIHVRLAEQGHLELARGVPGFGAALQAGWVALRTMAAAAVAAAGFVLPFTPLAAGGAWIVRRRRRQRPSVSSSTS